VSIIEHTHFNEWPKENYHAALKFQMIDNAVQHSSLVFFSETVVIL